MIVQRVGPTSTIGSGASALFYAYDSVSETDANTSNMRTQNVIGSGAYRFNFWVPPNFLEMESFAVVGNPLGSFADQSIWLDSNYYGPGQTLTQHVETDHTLLFSGIANEYFTLDITTVASQISARDFFGVSVDHKGIGTTIRYHGVEMHYKGSVI